MQRHPRVTCRMSKSCSLKRRVDGGRCYAKYTKESRARGNGYMKNGRIMNRWSKMRRSRTTFETENLLLLWYSHSSFALHSSYQHSIIFVSYPHSRIIFIPSLSFHPLIHLILSFPCESGDEGRKSSGWLFVYRGENRDWDFLLLPSTMFNCITLERE